ncbi:Bug family tripartite tricarboxylate transporter substrate binding protein [Diaphorobacter ruginosibacter]|uniref:Bug family tripartite tricarboxylate transporter substrate binding protein n=1 Tax=Diaphorobacter ruginosibacter TaxID=1715720 RepID=UPI001FE4AAE4|nr:tripartite tricarboxylate transporter substrate binding protein [Diaphorobacter ruginosibacter]
MRKSLAMFAMALTCLSASADNFPSQPVKLVVPWPPGGSTDVVLRAFASEAAKHLGQPIVIENKAGVGGTLGPQIVARTAKPDGYTITQHSVAVIRMPYMQDVQYDAVKDFTPIIGLTGYTFGIVANKDSRYKTWDDVVADAKKNPGKITYGSPGVGTSQHLATEAIAEKAGIQLQHVPFKGSSEVMAALLGGHLDLGVDSSGMAPHVDAGRMNLLITFGSERTKKWNTVPILKEYGYDLVFESPWGLAGPRGMPPEVVQKLHDAFKKALFSDNMKRVLESVDQPLVYLNAEDYRKFIIATNQSEGETLKRLGVLKK